MYYFRWDVENFILIRHKIDIVFLYANCSLITLAVYAIIMTIWNCEISLINICNLSFIKMIVIYWNRYWGNVSYKEVIVSLYNNIVSFVHVFIRNQMYMNIILKQIQYLFHYKILAFDINKDKHVSRSNCSDANIFN